MDFIDPKSLEKYFDQAVEMVMEYLPQLVLAIVTLFIGLWLINRLLAAVDRSVGKRFDPTLSKFVKSIASVGLKILLLVSVAGMVGIETTSFIAVLGAAGLAVGLALQGNLSNFASGVLILIFKPFRVGDWITTGSYTAAVKEIQIFTTILATGDNRKIVIPNSQLTTQPLINISSESTRRVDLNFGIGYDDDIDKARDVIKKIIEDDERIHKDPEPLIVVSELADSSVNFTVRVWCDAGDYWGIFYALTETVKKRFDAEGISIPYPQSDVHLFKENAA